MTTTTMYVTKSSEPKPKTNVALVDTQEDVPAFLQEVVTVMEGHIFLETTIEGAELCPTHSFIAWESDESCKGGYNVWNKSNGFQTLYYHEGVWYERPTVVKYSEINWACPSIPDFAAEAPLALFEGKIVLHAKWGDQTAYAPEPYAILGYPDGSFALLMLTSESARAYYVCTEEGRILEPLVK